MFDLCALPLRSGLIGLCPLPGRFGDYAGDLRRLLDWRPDLVVSLVTGNEFECSDAVSLSDDLAAAGVAWCHLPIRDFRSPAAGADTAWPAISDRAHRILAQGGRVLAHCYGGCGRSGMVLLRLMVEAGEAPEAALLRLRAVRPCAVETPGQFAWAGAVVATSNDGSAIAVGAG